MSEVIINEEETVDDILRGKLKIIQKKKGYRFSIDAILLADFIKVSEGFKIIDLGTGSGIIPLIIAYRFPNTSIIGVEIQKSLSDIALRNVKLNKYEEQISIINTDWKLLKNRFSRNSFDLVCSNPPYVKRNSGRLNPYDEKAIARHEIEGNLEEIAEISSYLLRPDGKFVCIYPVKRLIDIVTILSNYCLNISLLRFIYPNVKANARLVLVEAVKGGKLELEILEPLFIDSNYNL